MNGLDVPYTTGLCLACYYPSVEIAITLLFWVAVFTAHLWLPRWLR